METGTTGTGGSIAGIEAEIVTMADTRGIAGARIPGLAARDGATTETMILILKIATEATRRDGGTVQKTESTHQVVGGMILRSVRPEATDMIHIGTAMTAAIVATETQAPTTEETVLGSAPQHILALTESVNVSVMMPGKMLAKQRNRHGSWLPCSQMRPSLMKAERNGWRPWKVKNVLLERLMIRLGSEEEIEASSTDCIERH